MRHHQQFLDVVSQWFIWIGLVYAPTPPGIPLAQLEHQLRPVTYEQLIADLDVSTWQREAR